MDADNPDTTGTVTPRGYQPLEDATQMAAPPKKGDRMFRVWRGGFSDTVWAGSMVFDGVRWVSRGVRHDVTRDVDNLRDVDNP